MIYQFSISLTYFFLSDCGGILAAPSGVITSPNFPNVYNNSDACAWLIQQPEGYQVNVSNFCLFVSYCLIDVFVYLFFSYSRMLYGQERKFI